MYGELATLPAEVCSPFCVYLLVAGYNGACMNIRCCAGILGMPNGPFLYADQLLSVLTAKSEQGGFKDLVIYVVRSICPLL